MYGEPLHRFDVYSIRRILSITNCLISSPCLSRSTCFDEPDRQERLWAGAGCGWSCVSAIVSMSRDQPALMNQIVRRYSGLAWVVDDPAFLPAIVAMFELTLHWWEISASPVMGWRGWSMIHSFFPLWCYWKPKTQIWSWLCVRLLLESKFWPIWIISTRYWNSIRTHLFWFRSCQVCLLYYANIKHVNKSVVIIDCFVGIEPEVHNGKYKPRQNETKRRSKTSVKTTCVCNVCHKPFGFIKAMNLHKRNKEH